MLGTYALSSGYYDAYYLKALKVRRLIKNDFDQAFAACDVLLCPVAPTTAFRLGEKTADPLTMYLADIYTISVNLAGLAGAVAAGGTVARPACPSACSSSARSSARKRSSAPGGCSRRPPASAASSRPWPPRPARPGAKECRLHESPACPEP